MPWDVRTPVFEGPFDLLLHLVLRHHVDVHEVSVGAVVEAFLEEVDRRAREDISLDMEVATEFLLVAATLLELKARRLLPDQPEVDLDEELERWEERDLLLARLFESATFKEAATVLAGLEAESARSRPRRAGLEAPFVALAPDLLEGVTPQDVRAAFLRATAPSPAPRVDLGHLAPIRASVTAAVAELVGSLPGAGPVSFRRLTASLVDRLEVVVRFLALLELFKRGLVDLRQGGSFADISVTWTGGYRPPLTAELSGIEALDA